MCSKFHKYKSYIDCDENLDSSEAYTPNEQVALNCFRRHLDRGTLRVYFVTRYVASFATQDRYVATLQDRRSFSQFFSIQKGHMATLRDPKTCIATRVAQNVFFGRPFWTIDVFCAVLYNTKLVKKYKQCFHVKLSGEVWPKRSINSWYVIFCNRDYFSEKLPNIQSLHSKWLWFSNFVFTTIWVIGQFKMGILRRLPPKTVTLLTLRFKTMLYDFAWLKKLHCSLRDQKTHVATLRNPKKMLPPSELKTFGLQLFATEMFGVTLRG